MGQAKSDAQSGPLCCCKSEGQIKAQPVNAISPFSPSAKVSVSGCTLPATGELYAFNEGVMADQEGLHQGVNSINFPAGHVQTGPAEDTDAAGATAVAAAHISATDGVRLHDNTSGDARPANEEQRFASDGPDVAAGPADSRRQAEVLQQCLSDNSDQSVPVIPLQTFDCRDIDTSPALPSHTKEDRQSYHPSRSILKKTMLNNDNLIPEGGTASPRPPKAVSFTTKEALVISYNAHDSIALQQKKQGCLGCLPCVKK